VGNEVKTGIHSEGSAASAAECGTETEPIKEGTAILFRCFLSAVVKSFSEKC
jgi:hypothetical protein